MSNWNISILDRSVYYHTLKILSGDRSYLSCRWKSGAINWVVYPAKKSEYHVQMRRWLKWLGECHRTIGYNFLCICVWVVLWLWLSRAPDLKQGIMWRPNRKLEPTLLVARGVAVGFRRSRSVFAAIFFWTLLVKPRGSFSTSIELVFGPYFHPSGFESVTLVT